MASFWWQQVFKGQEKQVGMESQAGQHRTNSAQRGPVSKADSQRHGDLGSQHHLYSISNKPITTRSSIGCLKRPTDRQTDRHTHTHTHTLIHIHEKGAHSAQSSATTFQMRFCTPKALICMRLMAFFCANIATTQMKLMERLWKYQQPCFNNLPE